jgi:hypothetical protein
VSKIIAAYLETIPMDVRALFANFTIALLTAIFYWATGPAFALGFAVFMILQTLEDNKG